MGCYIFIISALRMLWVEIINWRLEWAMQWDFVSERKREKERERKEDMEDGERGGEGRGRMGRNGEKEEGRNEGMEWTNRSRTEYTHPRQHKANRIRSRKCPFCSALKWVSYNCCHSVLNCASFETQHTLRNGGWLQLRS